MYDFLFTESLIPFRQEKLKNKKNAKVNLVHFKSNLGWFKIHQSNEDFFSKMSNIIYSQTFVHDDNF